MTRAPQPGTRGSVALHYPSDGAIAEIAARVVDRSLPKSAWTHAAHFAAALWLLRYHPGFDGARDMPGLIRAYNLATGVANTDSGGYHHSITLASLAAAQAALAAAPGAPLHLILDDVLAGPCGRTDWLLAYWSHDRLFSAAARRGWMPPDLAPLPWPGMP